MFVDTFLNIIEPRGGPTRTKFDQLHVLMKQLPFPSHSSLTGQH